MNINTVTQLISSIGFPIVMCLLLYKRMVQSDEKLTTQINSLQETVNNNTTVIAELIHVFNRYGINLKEDKDELTKYN